MTSRILTFNPPVDGLSAIVNVLGRVGPGEANAADDVRAVQRLIQIAGKTRQVATGIGLPNCTGHFDAARDFGFTSCSIIKSAGTRTRLSMESSHPHMAPPMRRELTGPSCF